VVLGLWVLSGGYWTFQLNAAVGRVVSPADGVRRTGSGFVVRVEPDVVFIVTASHVVEGDKHPRVEFFTRRNTSIPAETVRLEGGDPRGLALLAVRGKENIPAGLVALTISTGNDLRGGEPVTVIGFPQGGGSWAVLHAGIVSLEGRELTLDGNIGEGNSGGPVLQGTNVVGVVTTVGGTGGFGQAVPATVVRLVLTGWGVDARPGSMSTAPPVSGDRRSDAGKAFDSSAGSLRIMRALCEKLRSNTAFRITLYGEGRGPQGAVLRASFLRDGKELSRPKTTCGSWKGCQRTEADPEKTDWKIAVMVLAPAPTDAAVALQPAADSGPDQAYALARTQLDCLLQ
jgi:hypothetical protein